MVSSLRKIFLAKTPASSVAQSLVVRILIVVLSLGCGIITARGLGPAGRGGQNAIVLWPYLLSGLAGFGIAPALLYHTSKARKSEGGLLFTATVLTLFTGLFGAFVGTIIMPFYLRRYSPDIVHAAQLTAYFTPALLVGYVFRAHLEAMGQFTSSNLSRIWPFLYTLIGLGLLWGFHRLTPFTAGLALFTPYVFQTLWLGRDLFDRFVITKTFVADTRLLLSYGLRTYGTDVFYTLSTQVDTAFIIAFLSPSALGLYGIALTASRQLTLVQTALNTVLLPKAAALDNDDAIELVSRMARVNNLVTSIAGLVALAAVPILIRILYGKAFSAAGSITQILIFETFLMGIASVLAQAFNATGKPGVVSLFQAGWIATTAILLGILIPRLGLHGAAYALLGSSFIRVLATLACFPLVLHKPVPRLIPTSGDVAYIVNKVRSYIKAPKPALPVEA